MHEAAIAKSILDIADRRAAKMPGADITAIRVRIGSFTNVEPESLEFAFDGLKKEYAACCQSRLELDLIQAEAVCLKRKHRFSPTMALGFRCQQCGSGIGELLHGQELDVIGCVFSLPTKVPHV